MTIEQLRKALYRINQKDALISVDQLWDIVDNWPHAINEANEYKESWKSVSLLKDKAELEKIQLAEKLNYQRLDFSA